MCILIDVNSLNRVFHADNQEHHLFKPVHDWIFYSIGKLIYGGSTYMAEVPLKYKKLFRILSDSNKAINLSDINEKIDKREKELNKCSAGKRNFNDAHLIALLDISNCQILCTYDDKAIPHIKNAQLYQKSPPKIYSKNSLKSAKKILNIQNIPDRYKPYKCLPKKTQEMLRASITNLLKD